MTPRLRRRRARATRVVEEDAALRLGGRRLPASGALPRGRLASAGGDIVHPRALIEHKRTETDEIRVTEAWLKKVCVGAAAMGKHPVLIVRVGTADPVEAALLPWSLVCVSGGASAMGRTVRGITTTARSVLLRRPELVSVSVGDEAVLIELPAYPAPSWLLVSFEAARVALGGS